MNITVIGCGRWGSFIAWYLDRTGHTVTLYGRKSSSHIQQFIATRSNGLLTLPESIQLTTDLDAVDKADVIVISIAAQSLDSLMTQLQTMKLQNKIFVLCMKGIEIGTGRETVADCFSASGCFKQSGCMDRTGGMFRSFITVFRTAW